MHCATTLRMAARATALRRMAITGARLPACSNQRQMSSGHGEMDIMDKRQYPKGYHPATYDEAIVPSGSWHDNNEALQMKYNRQLIVGVLIFVSTVYYITICPDIDFVMTPDSVGVNPPKFTVLPPKDA